MEVRTAINTFFNTQSQHPRCGLQLTGEFFLTPVRFWFNGDTIKEELQNVEIKDKAIVVIMHYTYLKDRAQQLGYQKNLLGRITQVAMAILFLPGLIVGTALKTVAYCNFVFALLGCLKAVIVQQYYYTKFASTPPIRACNFSKVSDAINDKNFEGLSQATSVIYEKKVCQLYRIKYLNSEDPKAEKINNFNDLKLAKTGYFAKAYTIDPEVAPLKKPTLPKQGLDIWTYWNPTQPTVAA